MRLQGIPVSDFNPMLPASIQALPKNAMLSTTALPSADMVQNGTVVSSNTDSTLAEAMNSGKSSSNTPLENAQSPSAEPKSLARNTSLPDVNNVGEYEETGNEDDDDPEIKHDDSEDEDQSDKPLRLKQKRRNDNSAKLSTKRKADTLGRKKAMGSEVTPPVKKKRKVNKPTAKPQRKAGNVKRKTAKERFLAASAEDTRPLPWGQPDVWAEVWSPRR